MKLISLILSTTLLFSFELSFNENPIQVIQDSEELAHPFSGGLNKPKIQWIDWDNDDDDDLFILDEDGYIRYMENISIGSNISTTSFNEAFDKGRKTNNYSKQIMKIDEPFATISGDLGFSELGQDNINSFSKTEGDSNSIQFTDYKDAYTTDSKLIAVIQYKD